MTEYYRYVRSTKNVPVIGFQGEESKGADGSGKIDQLVRSFDQVLPKIE
jgi:hypothetical protein